MSKNVLPGPVVPLGNAIILAITANTALDTDGPHSISVSAAPGLSLLLPGAPGNNASDNQPTPGEAFAFRNTGLNDITITNTAGATEGDIVLAAGASLELEYTALNGYIVMENSADDASSSALGATALIFQPGGVSAGNVFATWAEIMAAFAAAPAGPKTILLDDSITSPLVIPDGSYALPEATLKARGPTPGNITIGEVAFTGGLAAIEGPGLLTFNGSVPAIDIGSDGHLTIANNIAIFSTVSPFIEVSIGTGNLLCRDESDLGVGTVSVAGAGAGIALTLFNISGIGAGVFVGGAGASGIVRRDDTCNFTQPTGPSWLGITPWSDTLLSRATRLRYSDTTGGAWGGPGAPVDVNEALNRLAAAVDALSGPIP